MDEQQTNQMPERLFVLALSVSLDAMIYFAPRIAGIEFWKLVTPFVPFFVAALAIALAWPRQWLVVGIAPMVLGLIIASAAMMQGANNQPGFTIAVFAIHTVAASLGSVIGMAIGRRRH
jgi:hypothetical protein